MNTTADIRVAVATLANDRFAFRCKMACTWLERAQDARVRGELEAARNAIGVARFWAMRAEDLLSGEPVVWTAARAEVA